MVKKHITLAAIIILLLILILPTNPFDFIFMYLFTTLGMKAYLVLVAAVVGFAWWHKPTRNIIKGWLRRIQAL